MDFMRMAAKANRDYNLSLKQQLTIDRMINRRDYHRVCPVHALYIVTTEAERNYILERYIYADYNGDINELINSVIEIAGDYESAGMIEQSKAYKFAAKKIAEFNK